MTRPRSPLLTPRTAFLAGLSLALLPAVGPFVAVMLLIGRGWSLDPRDRLWAAAALLFGLASGVSGGIVQGLVGTFTIVGPWIVFRSFAELRSLDVDPRSKGAAAAGLLTGFAAVVVGGLALSVQSVDVTTALTAATAVAWDGAPATFGHAVLVLGVLIAVVTREHRLAPGAALGLAALGVVISGNREAAVAWTAAAAILAATGVPRARWQRGVGTIVLAVMALIALGLSPWLGIGRIGFTIAGGGAAGGGAAGDGAAGGAPSRNLFVGTELPDGDWWDDRWVDVSSETVRVGDRPLTAYRVEKDGGEQWLRLQQLVRLTPGATYTLSAWIDVATEGVPGFQGWGEPARTGANAAGDAAPFFVAGAWRAGDWTANVSGPGRLVGHEVVDRDRDWRRVAVTFAYDGPQPLPWFVGFAPDARDTDPDAPTVPGRMAGLQLEEGEAATPYQPGGPLGGLSFAYARAPLWDAAWHGFLQRPWFGWGPDAFPELMSERRPGVEQRQLLPAHAHNLVLRTLSEQGLVGLAGTVLLLIALFGPAFRSRDVGMQAVLAAVLILNLFDATLWSGSVLFPLAAAAGWRQAGRAPLRAGGIDNARQAAVRVGLALGDVAAAGAALGVALGVTQALAWLGSDAAQIAPVQVGPALPYALALWPALAWREGLYPGYGLTPPQELAKQTATATYAGLLFVGGTLLFPGDLGLPTGTLLIFLAATFVTGPIVRALAKRTLHAAGMWGRAVVILGAGDTGGRIARALLRDPLDGLHPVAFFDDDPALHGKRLHNVRVRGDLNTAYAFSRRHGVHHAIVAIPSIGAEKLDRLVATTGRVFRRVRFVPKLGDLPSEEVTASEMDGMLTLEVRNGLYAPANRAAKRATDLLGSVVLLTLLSPVLAALWAWVRLDSPGGALYASERVGQGGRIFPCIKFRTMHRDAEAQLQRLMASDPAIREEYEHWHKLEHDPRITRAGRFLRRTSLDELPQLWNVLRGEMSLVGPRPYLARELPDMGRAGEVILQAKPGMTGYWQVSGRSSIPFAERLRMESYYVRNWSIWWDVILLLRTPMVLIRKRTDAK